MTDRFARRPMATEEIEAAKLAEESLIGAILIGVTDVEATKEDHERRIWAIKEGLGIEDDNDIFYRHCMSPLVNDLIP